MFTDYIEDYNSEATTDYLNIIYLDRHYKALFKGPVRLLQVRNRWKHHWISVRMLTVMRSRSIL